MSKVLKLAGDEQIKLQDVLYPATESEGKAPSEYPGGGGFCCEKHIRARSLSVASKQKEHLVIPASDLPPCHIEFLREAVGYLASGASVEEAVAIAKKSIYTQLVEDFGWECTDCDRFNAGMTAETLKSYIKEDE